MKYSIITVNYNNKNGLRKTIESVIHQSFRDFEYIVIDGGSTDGSADVLKEYDAQIDYWVSEPDKGIYNAMNKGIAQAKGEYLNFMNSGDCFYNANVLKQVSECGYTTDMIIGKDYHFDPTSQRGFATIHPPRLSMLTFFIQTLPHQSTFFKRQIFDKIVFDENLKMVSDLKFYVQKICVDACSVRFINHIICLREPDGISNIYSEVGKDEHKYVMSCYLPKGALLDYETLHLLDNSTIYKFFSLCQKAKTRKLLIYCIKVINRLFI